MPDRPASGSAERKAGRVPPAISAYARWASIHRSSAGPLSTLAITA